MIGRYYWIAFFDRSSDSEWSGSTVMMRILAWLEIRFPGIARYWTGDSILWVGAARDRWGYWHFIPWTGCHEYQKQHSFSSPVLLAFTGTGYSNYLVSIPSIWLPGRFIALPFHRKRLPVQCGTIIPVDWMNEQKRCEPRESERDLDVKFPLLFPSRIYIMFWHCCWCVLRMFYGIAKMRTKGSIEDPIRE